MCNGHELNSPISSEALGSISIKLQWRLDQLVELDQGCHSRCTGAMLQHRAPGYNAIFHSKARWLEWNELTRQVRSFETVSLHPKPFISTGWDVNTICQIVQPCASLAVVQLSRIYSIECDRNVRQILTAKFTAAFFHKIAIVSL